MAKRNIACFPEEVLEHVFSYLDLYDKLNISATCKRFLEVMNNPMLLRDITVRWNDHSGPELPFHSFRKFTSFELICISLSEEHLEFFKSYGDNIRKLTIRKCSISENLRKKFFQHKLCKNLNELKFSGCYTDNIFYLFSFLPELKVLRFERSNIAIYEGMQWCNVAPNLEEIYYAHSSMHGNLDYDPHILMRFFDSFKSIKVYYDNYQFCTYLLPKLQNAQLKQVLFSDLQFCTNFFEVHDKVTELIFNNFVENESSKNRDKLIIQICDQLPSLEKLTLVDFSLNLCVVKIFKLQNLKSLKLKSIAIEKESSLNDAVLASRVECLQELYLEDVSLHLGNETFRNLLIRIPKLRFLGLINCKNYVNNVTMQFISKYLTYLRDLHISCSDNLTDEALFLPDKYDCSLSNIKGLKNLTIRNCPNISSNGMLKALEFLELRCLTVDGKHKQKLHKSLLRRKNPSIRKIEFGR